jgi:hypothetical protein
MIDWTRETPNRHAANAACRKSPSLEYPPSP